MNPASGGKKRPQNVHEKERMEIAVNGHRAVKKFDYIYVLKHILGVD